MTESVLNEYELRVLGALVEKQIATPDYYPLTLNALTNACNQKNHRDPVVGYDEATVVKALDSLREKKLAYTFHGAEARVTKYGHLFPKAFDLDEAQTSVMCVLILRGPQTPGELRARTAHLYNFESLAEVENALQALSSRDHPLVIRLPRQPGSRETRYAQTLAGEPQFEAQDLADRHENAPAHTSPENERMVRLEEEVGSLRHEIAELKQMIENFKRQFE